MLILVAGLAVLAGCTRPSAAAFTTQVAPTTAPSVVPTTLPPPPPTTATPAPATVAPIVFNGAGFDLHTAGRVPTAAFNAAWAGALETLNRYLDAAVLTPLRTGGPAGDLTPFFTAPAAAKVTVSGPDRSAFIDEGLPPLSDVKKETAVAQLAALAGSDGVMSVITAALDLRLTGHVGGEPVSVQRTGELVLMPEGGRWRIDAYELKVVRTLDQDATTTTVRS